MWMPGTGKIWLVSRKLCMEPSVSLALGFQGMCATVEPVTKGLPMVHACLSDQASDPEVLEHMHGKMWVQA